MLDEECDNNDNKLVVHNGEQSILKEQEEDIIWQPSFLGLIVYLLYGNM